MLRRSSSAKPLPGPAPFALGAAAIAGGVGFAVAQPLYDLMSRNAAFLVAHQADGWDLLWLCCALSIAMPLALGVVVWCCRALGSLATRIALATVLGLCAALFALAVLRRIDAPAWISFVAATAAAGATAFLADRRGFVRATALLGLGALVFPTLFFINPGIRTLLADDPPEQEAPRRRSRAPAPEVPVVLIIFDEFPTVSLMTPERQIDSGRFPNFSRLAATSTWYRRATTVAQSTIYAVPAILTGLYPVKDMAKVPSRKDYPRSLFTMLPKSTDFNAWETLTNLCRPKTCPPPERWAIPRRERLLNLLADLSAVYLRLIAPARWSAGLPGIEDQWRDFWSARDSTASDRPEGAGRRERPADLFSWFLNTVEQRQGRPAVHYAHVMLPHRPWIWLPDGRTFASYADYPHGLTNQFWRGSEWETTQAHQRHLLTVGFVDTLVGRLMDVLQRTGGFERSLVILTSDHGTTFNTGETRRNLLLEPTEEITGVPLFVKYPGQRTGVIDDRNAETVDILPTILSVLGLTSKEPLDGRPLNGSAEAKPPLKTTFRSGNPGASSGSWFEYTSADQETERQAAVDGIAARFGTGSWESLFAAGPRPDLLGRRPGSLAVVSPVSPVRATLRGLAPSDAVDLDATKVPIHLYGSLLDSTRPAGEPLVIALNGRIQASTESFSTMDGRREFTVLLPLTALRNGSNEIEIFLVEGTDEDTALLPLSLETGELEEPGRQ